MMQNKVGEGLPESNRETLLRRYWVIISVIILVISGAWIWFSRAPSGSSSNIDISAPRKGFSAPDFTLRSSDGSSLTLSDLRGNPLIINIWASWCPPCRAEMPAMQRVYEKYRDDGFIILAVNSSFQDDPEKAQAFADELGLDFPILFDQDGNVSHLYQASALPSSYFVDRDGIIQQVVVGGPMSEALLNIRVEQLLEQAVLE